MKTLKLAVVFLCERPSRVALTTLATAAAVCMVVWVTSSYEALHKTYDEYADLALGRYALAIAPISAEETDFVPPEVLQPLREDPAVLAVDPMGAQRYAIKIEEPSLSAMPDSDSAPAAENAFGSGPGSGPGGLLPSLLFIATDSPAPPFDMVEGVWIGAASAPPRGVVLREDVAQQRDISLHDHITLELPRPDEDGTATISLRVIGIVNAPSLPGAEAATLPMLTPSSGEAYISTALAERISGVPLRISLLGLSLDPAVDITKFRFGWAPRLSDYAVPLQFQEAFEIEEALDQAAAAQNVRLQAHAATAIATLMALLVVFCSLSMGVSERIRQYAILRAVALTQGQLGWLILIEAALLGSLGLTLGIAMGWTLLWAADAMFGRILYHGVDFGASSLTLSMIAAMGGALLAAAIPAHRAMRVKPLDALAPRRWSTRVPSAAWPRAAFGMALIAAGPLATFGFPLSERHVWAAMAAGFACMLAGFVVIAPTIVVLVDHWLGLPSALVFRIDPKLLASQITNQIWRTVGASISMALGLGIFVGIHVWGFTMLEAFIPGDWTPDAIATFPAGLPVEQAERVASLPTVDADRCLPIVVEQPRLANDITGSAVRASVTRQDNIIIVGIDPARALAGEHPLLQLEWVAGTPAEAIAAMESGRGCVVPDHFLLETGLSLGDMIALDPPRNAGHVAKYAIAGAVRLPGWHWQTKLTGMRPRTHRAAAIVFADYDSVASDFDLTLATHVWFSYAMPLADVDGLEAEIRSLFPPPRTATADDPGADVRVMPVQSIRDHIRGTARRWIWVTSIVPLITLLIACLGVLNVILASVRARRGEFGILRSIGFTSSELTRAILAEGVMIAMVAGMLGIGFGILSGWCGAGLAQHISFFGGLNPSLVIPWPPIACGVLLVVLLGLLTAAWPAWSIRRSRPMDLVRAGGDFT